MPIIPNIASDVVSGALNVQVPGGFGGPYPPNTLTNSENIPYLFGVPLSDGSYNLWTEGDANSLLVPTDYHAWKPRAGDLAPGNWEAGGAEYLGVPDRVTRIGQTFELSLLFVGVFVFLSRTKRLRDTRLTLDNGLIIGPPRYIARINNTYRVEFTSPLNTAQPAYLSCGPGTWLPNHPNARSLGFNQFPVTPQP